MSLFVKSYHCEQISIPDDSLLNDCISMEEDELMLKKKMEEEMRKKFNMRYQVNALKADINNLKLSVNDISNEEINDMESKINKTFDDMMKYLIDKKEEIMNELNVMKIQEIKIQETNKKNQDKLDNKSNDIKSKVYTIGLHQYDELTVNNMENVERLLPLNEINNVSSIYTGAMFDIFVDDTNNYISSDRNISEYLAKLIKYFFRSDIKIKKICISCYGHNIFWITNEQIIYENNIYDIDKLQSDIYILERAANIGPRLVSSLKNAIDIQSTKEYSFALCTNGNKTEIIMIILYWWRMNRIKHIHYDIITNLIVEYYCYNTVYESRNDRNDRNDWNECVVLNDLYMKIKMNIIQIATGSTHALLLDSNGTVFVQGDDDYGQLGGNATIGEYLEILQYFDENNIKIKYIDCGKNHSLTITSKNVLYAFGENKYFQCGINDKHNIDKPQIIPKLKDCEILRISCGDNHNYAYCKNGNHYLWGDNQYNQCMMINNDKLVIKEPYCINKILNEQISDGFTLKHIYLGTANTTLKCVLNKIN